MSDQHHVEPENPPADDFATRLFILTNIGVLAFIAIVFTFIIL
jgi:hypothetical protein